MADIKHGPQRQAIELRESFSTSSTIKELPDAEDSTNPLHERHTFPGLTPQDLGKRLQAQNLQLYQAEERFVPITIYYPESLISMRPAPFADARYPIYPSSYVPNTSEEKKHYIDALIPLLDNNSCLRHLLSIERDDLVARYEGPGGAPVFPGAEIQHQKEVSDTIKEREESESPKGEAFVSEQAQSLMHEGNVTSHPDEGEIYPRIPLRLRALAALKIVEDVLRYPFAKGPSYVMVNTERNTVWIERLRDKKTADREERSEHR